MQPYFSLILPVYNVEAYLDRCMQSILDQDFSDYEVILVDDGSPDGCPAICDAYARRYGHVRVIHKPNGGLSSARNEGLRAARGKYIWWIDSDDWIEPDSLKILHAASCADAPDAVKFNYYRVDARREKICSNAPEGSCSGEALEKLIRLAFCAAGRFGLSAWMHVYRRAFIEERGLVFLHEKELGSEDYLFNLALFPQAKKLRVVSDALYNYDRREGSITQKYRANLAAKYNVLREKLMDCYKSADLYAKYAGLIHRFYVWHLIAGTCMPYEYEYISAEHTLRDARRNVRRMFAMKEFRQSLKLADRKDLSLKRRIQMGAMGLGFEPLFHYLYVVKPNRKKN